MKRILVELDVNGELAEVPARPAATLLDVLRDGLHLTGSKRGCDQGVCGACTVLVDGRPARACLMLAVDCEGREITTIEGLRGSPETAALQKALADGAAIQCGYCTPGIVLSLVDLARRGEGASTDEVRRAISGNICRCSGYVKIVETAERCLAGLAATQEAGDGR